MPKSGQNSPPSTRSKTRKNPDNGNPDDGDPNTDHQNQAIKKTSQVKKVLNDIISFSSSKKLSLFRSMKNKKKLVIQKTIIAN
jgi:hypothetical protein